MAESQESRFLTMLREFAGHPDADRGLAQFVGVTPSKITAWKKGMKPTMNIWGKIRDRIGPERTARLFLAALEDQAVSMTGRSRGVVSERSGASMKEGHGGPHLRKRSTAAVARRRSAAGG